MLIGFDILVVLEVMISTNEVSWWYEKGWVTEVDLTIIFSVLGVYTERALMPSSPGDKNVVVGRACERRSIQSCDFAKFVWYQDKDKQGRGMV